MRSGDEQKQGRKTEIKKRFVGSKGKIEGIEIDYMMRSFFEIHKPHFSWMTCVVSRSNLNHPFPPIRSGRDTEREKCDRSGRDAHKR